jgi:hypothetical protein
VEISNGNAAWRKCGGKQEHVTRRGQEKSAWADEIREQAIERRFERL